MKTFEYRLTWCEEDSNETLITGGIVFANSYAEAVVELGNEYGNIRSFDYLCEWDTGNSIEWDEIEYNAKYIDIHYNEEEK